MATKNTNTSAIFNRFYSLNHKFREGVIVGVVLSEDHSEDNILADYSEDITNAIDKYDIRLIDVYSIEIIADGVYNFIVVRYDPSDDDDWESFKIITIGAAIRRVKEVTRYYAFSPKEAYVAFKRSQFVNTVEEKNFLQQLFSLIGWEMFTHPIKDAFTNDIFYKAFERACVEYNGGKDYVQIPNAETIFRVYKKCLKRWNVEEEEEKEEA